MDCPSLDVIDIKPENYPDILKSIKITLRGGKNLFDIYFCMIDIENSFNVEIPNGIDITWINTPSGRSKYLSYPSLKRFLFQIIYKNPLAELYMQWVDGLLFNNNNTNLFFRKNIDDVETEDTSSDIDDTDSIDSCEYSSNILSILKQRIVQLEHQIEIKNKDIDIIRRDVQLRDKEIEILHLKLGTTNVQSEWI